MPGSNLIVKKPNHRKAIVLTSIIVAVIAVAAIIIYVFVLRNNKTATLSNKIQNISTQIAAIPNLDTKENVDKFNNLVVEFQTTRKQQEQNLKAQFDKISK